MSKKSKNIMLLMFLWQVFLFLFSKLTDMRPLLDIEVRYSRTKGEKKENKKASMELLYIAAFKTDSFHSVKKQYFSTPALL